MSTSSHSTHPSSRRVRDSSQLRERASTARRTTSSSAFGTAFGSGACPTTAQT